MTILRRQVSLWALTFASTVVLAQSEIPITTFTDNKCSVISSSSPNVSVPLDACVTTVGMQSFRLSNIPCAGGSATHVLYYAFSDGHCSTEWGGDSYDGDCKYAITAGNAFGSIMLSCTDFGFSTPSSSGATTTINVGSVATGASSSSPSVQAGSGSTGGSSLGSGSNSDSGSGSSHASCGYSCLPNTVRVIIPIAGTAAVLFLLIAVRCWRQRRRRRARALQRNDFFQNRASFQPTNNFAQTPTNMATRFPVEPVSISAWDDGQPMHQHNRSRLQSNTHSTARHTNSNQNNTSDVQTFGAARQHEQTTTTTTNPLKEFRSTSSEVTQTTMSQPPPYERSEPERQRFEPAHRGRPNSSTFPFFQSRRHQNEG